MSCRKDHKRGRSGEKKKLLMEKGGWGTFIDFDRVMDRHRQILPKSIYADNELWRLPFRKKNCHLEPVVYYGNRCCKAPLAFNCLLEIVRAACTKESKSLTSNSFADLLMQPRCCGLGLGRVNHLVRRIPASFGDDTPHSQEILMAPVHTMNDSMSKNENRKQPSPHLLKQTIIR